MIQKKRRVLLLLIFAVMSLTNSPCYELDTPAGKLPPEARLVAHALGEFKGHGGMNCKEAFENSYRLGLRYFEADLWITGDGKLVLFHDRFESSFGLNRGFTASDFKDKMLLGICTSLDADQLAKLMVQYPDWTLITDTKSEFKSSIQLLCDALIKNHLNCQDRVIPQIYNWDSDYKAAGELGFSRVILTLYHYSDSPLVIQKMKSWFNDLTFFLRADSWKAVQALKEVYYQYTHKTKKVTPDDPIVAFLARDRSGPKRIIALTLATSRWNVQLVRLVNSLNIPVYVHTVNKREEILDYLKNGAFGVYSDSFTDFKLLPSS